jgi:hypothetical protein
MTRLPLVFVSLGAMLLAACASRLTRDLPQGDVDRGRHAFVELQCTGCHEVPGLSLPAPTTLPAVALGGRTLVPPSRERLAQDIILPSSHYVADYPVSQFTRDGRSRMPDYRKLTRDQLADLIAFLQSRYQFGLPRPTRSESPEHRAGSD